MNPALIPVSPACTQPVRIDPVFVARRDELVTRAAAVPAITDPASCEAAAAVLRDVTRLVKDADAQRLALQRPFSDMVATIRDAVQKEMATLVHAQERLKGATAQYMAEVRAREDAERRRQAEEARKQAEADRLAAEEARKAEEMERELFGDAPTSMPVPTLPPPVAVRPAPEPVIATKIAGMATVETIQWAVDNMREVPVALLTTNDQAIRRFLTENRDKLLPMIREEEAAGRTCVVNGLMLKIETTTRSR